MKNQKLESLEKELTTLLEPIIETPYRVICSYYDRTLRVTLINLTNGKSYLIATVLGSKTKDDQSFIEYFYVMPQFHNLGIGRRLLRYYSDFQVMEGSKELYLKPLPFVPGSRDPIEYLRLVNWLGGKDYVRMTRRNLVQFYESVGFQSLDPDILDAEMYKVITA